MLDLKWIRENSEEFGKLLAKRGAQINIDELLELDEEKRQLTTLIQQFQQARNAKSKKLGTLKATKEFDIIKRDVEHINEKLEELNNQLTKSDKLQNLMDMIPNLPLDEVPYGTDETMNKLVRTFKDPIEIPNAKEHFDLGRELEMMDFEQTAKISGSRFVTLSGSLARMERALINFMLDLHINNFSYQEISPPALVRNQSMYNTGQLPKMADDSYSIDNSGFRLIPTGEVPLTNMVAEKILTKEELPIRYVAYTNCFRSEAGSAGKDTRGMIRNHQFGKVELVSITAQEDSPKEHEFMLNAAEEVLKRLDLPYRVMLLCSGDMGFTSRKTYDLEVWLPGQKKYREISSVSNCGDFQARRMRARYREMGNSETKFVHSLNGSALAVGRTIVAIMENYQNYDGSITIPQALQPYMGGMSKIQKKL